MVEGEDVEGFGNREAFKVQQSFEQNGRLAMLLGRGRGLPASGLLALAVMEEVGGKRMEEGFRRPVNP